jgi:hypothetical protein
LTFYVSLANIPPRERSSCPRRRSSAFKSLRPTQTGKETTINNAILALEAATNATLAVSMAGGDVTLSVAQFTGSMVFNLLGSHLFLASSTSQPSSTGSTPAACSWFATRATYIITVQVTGGAGTAVNLNPQAKPVCSTSMAQATSTCGGSGQRLCGLHRRDHESQHRRRRS